ncbi:MAG: alpha/beta hydrolase [Candidatus Eisenbacteria bacterium]|uniref:Alpha/beta hydrolase n=1 Tax=Eiseniibacteriota bacterium TaxID=2212470 RepID=A0A956LYN7_UNCEI|nr:alpha/beta hydrolase [Candidatus Eisenbacteria bacterium]
MYVVTNREILTGKTGLDQIGKRPNAAGPHELRLVEVTPRGKGWSVSVLEDELKKQEASQLIKGFHLPLDPAQTQYASLKVACDLVAKARKARRHVLFFVHGFNNDLEDVVKRATDLADRYGVEVLAFSWPANGGGKVSGVASYKSDKRDARASTGALERTLKKMREYLTMITDAHQHKLLEQATAKHPDNPSARDALYAKLLEAECPFTVNAMFHSMGNYLLKQMLKSTVTEGNELVFDNVVLCQADTNNLDHELWVDAIRFRRRLFITINEHDFALRASRMKSGSEQLARLGHFTRNLNSRNARYVNLTDASWVKSSHTPFAEPAARNAELFQFFKAAFSGDPGEEGMRFVPEGNWFVPR